MLKRVLSTCLLLLVGGNILWALLLGRATPLVGAAVYAVVAFQVLRRNEYRAAFFVGLAGGGLHLFEILRGGLRSTALDALLALANVALPFVIASLGLAVWRLRLGGR